MRSFVGWSLICPLHPPANVRSLEMKKFYICSDVTVWPKSALVEILDRKNVELMGFYSDLMFFFVGY